MKVSGGECLVPLRMEVSNKRPEGISGKDIFGGLVALGKGQSLTHVCQSGKDRQSLSLCQGGVDLSALWGGERAGTGWAEAFTFCLPLS